MKQREAIEALLAAYLDIDCPECLLDDNALAERDDILKRLHLPPDLHANLLGMRFDWLSDEAIDRHADGAREIRISGRKIESLKRRIFTKIADIAKPGDIVFSIRRNLDETHPRPNSALGRLRRRARVRLDAWLGNDPSDRSSWTTMLYLGYCPAPKYKSKKQLYCTHVCQNSRCEHIDLGMFGIDCRSQPRIQKILEFHRYRDKAYLSVDERKAIICKSLSQIIRKIPFDNRPRKVILSCALGLPSRPLDPENPHHMMCFDQVVINYAAVGKYFDHPRSIRQSPFNIPARLTGHPIGHGARVNPRFSYLHDRTLYYNTRTFPILSLHQEAVTGSPSKRGDYVFKFRPPKGHWERSQ